VDLRAFLNSGRPVELVLCSICSVALVCPLLVLFALVFARSVLDVIGATTAVDADAVASCVVTGGGFLLRTQCMFFS